MAKFKDDFLHLSPSVLLTDVVEGAVAQYNKVIHDLVEAHAPMKKCKVKIKEGALWYNSDIHQAKQLRPRYERHWRHPKSDTDLNVFKKTKIISE